MKSNKESHRSVTPEEKLATVLAESDTVIAQSDAADVAAELQLSTQERTRLSEHEATIARGSKTFIEVGNALAAIRDGKLYRRDYKTFEAYCRERWEFSRIRAHQLIASAIIADNLLTTVNNAPTSERQIRPLTTVDPAEVGDVWQEVIDRAEKDDEGRPKITAKHVEETVKLWKAADEKYVAEEDKKPKPFDFDGESNRLIAWVRTKAKTWPNEFREAFAKVLIQLAKEVR